LHVLINNQPLTKYFIFYEPRLVQGKWICSSVMELGFRRFFERGVLVKLGVWHLRGD
jgi:hypothetical protein